MTTQITCGNPSQISEMQKTLSVISTNFTPPPHMPCYGPTSGTTHSNGLSQFFSFLFILSDRFRLWTMRRFSMRSSLISQPSPFHKYMFASWRTLFYDSSFLCCAWLCCHTHAHHTCLCFSSILPPPHGCIMLLIPVMLALNSIGRSDTNMYIQVW